TRPRMPASGRITLISLFWIAIRLDSTLPRAMVDPRHRHMVSAVKPARRAKMDIENLRAEDPRRTRSGSSVMTDGSGRKEAHEQAAVDQVEADFEMRLEIGTKTHGTDRILE